MGRHTFCCQKRTTALISQKSEATLISTEKQAEMLQSSDISKISLRNGEKKRGSTRRPADPIRSFRCYDLLNKRLLFRTSSCIGNQDYKRSKD